MMPPGRSVTARRHVPTVRIGGIPIAALRFEEALELFLRAPAEGLRLQVHFCTTHTIVEAHDDPRLRAALQSGLAVADGLPIAWEGRARGFPIGRVCGPDLMPALVDRARAQGARHFFYGGAAGVAEQLAERLAIRYPGIVVAGIESPPFRPLSAVEDEAMVDRLNRAQPDYVWVGLGTPKQDHWLADHRDRLDAAALLAVGAAFDILGGYRARAPLAIQRLGLEWAFRFAQEPRRLGRRYVVANTRFIGLALGDLARRRWRRHDR
jgi:N-acetylglucosaminyldiphosphoundecaprenol N-acetyl-beta-D-mannosaminyltransferase